MDCLSKTEKKSMLKELNKYANKSDDDNEKDI